MSQAVLYVDETGRASINAFALMESAIKLVFDTTPPSDIDSATIPGHIERVHASLFDVTTRLLARGLTGAPTAPGQLNLGRPAQPPAALPQEMVLPEPQAVQEPVQQAFDLGEVEPIAAAEAPRRRRQDAVVAAPQLRLPRRLTRIEDALRTDNIVCLEDGKIVTDLGKHLASIGMTPEAYLTKWNLPESYPMKAPSVIQKRGIEYEFDAVHNRMIRT